MKSRWPWIALGSVLLSGCTLRTDMPAPSVVTAPPPEIATSKVEVFKPTLDVRGLISSSTDVDLKAPSSGVLVRWAVKSGDPVKQGQVIATLMVSPRGSDDGGISSETYASLPPVSPMRPASIPEELNTGEKAQRRLKAAEEKVEALRTELRSGGRKSDGEIARAKTRWETARQRLADALSVDHPRRRNEAEAKVEEAESLAQKIQSDKDKCDQLLAAGAISQNEFDAKVRQLDAAKSAAAKAREQRDDLEATLSKEKKRLDDEVKRSAAALNRSQGGSSVTVELQQELAKAMEELSAAQKDAAKYASDGGGISGPMLSPEPDAFPSVRGRIRTGSRSITISSPMDGVLIAPDAKTGQVAEGSVLGKVSRSNFRVFITTIPTPTAINLKPGTPLTVQLDSMAKKDLPAKVFNLKPGTKPTDTILEIKVLANDPLIKPGVAGKAMIPTGIQTKRVTLTKRAIQFIRPGVGNVRLEQGGQLREVKLGRDLVDRMEVLSGLESEQRVLVLRAR